MEFLKFSLSGFDDFLIYFALSIVFVALYMAIYVRVTPYREFALIREGNTAAAASLAGSLFGFVNPLASAIVHSVNPWDMALWALIALVVQIAVYLAVRLMMPEVAKNITEGKLGSGAFLGAVSLAAGMLNAACMTY